MADQTQDPTKVLEEGGSKEAAAIEKAKGKQPKKEKDDADSDGSDDEEVDFQADDEDSDSSDTDSSDSDDSDDEVDEKELDDDAAGEVAEAGPSSGKKKRKKSPDLEHPQILDGLSGDEVDPNLILGGGRRARRGSGSRPKYTATVAQESDEDEW